MAACASPASCRSAGRGGGPPPGPERRTPALELARTDAYLADVRRDEDVLARVATHQTWKVFRYPFLQQGDTVEKRDGVRRFLAEAGYAIAEVTIDADDWAFNAPFVRCTEQGDESAVA